MDDVREIQAAIARLPTAKRARVARWALLLSDEVHETPAAYLAGAPVLLSVDEYLEREERSGLRHEYVDGLVHPMADASGLHNLVSGNIFAAIHVHLRGGSCRACMSGVKLRLNFEEGDIFYYPDVMVRCDHARVEEPYLRHPTLIVEVLSPSTASIDRREKLLNYRRIPSLEEYVIAAQHAPEVVIHRRADSWAPCVLAGPDASLELRSIGLTLALARIYDGAFPRLQATR